MNIDFATLVLKGLLERASLDRRNTFLSEVEMEAVRLLIGHPASEGPIYEGENKDSEPSGSTLFEPVIKWLPNKLDDNETRVCIDFGTSFSKAFACDGEDPQEAPKLIDIVLSQDAEDSARYLLPSEMIIHDGEIYFGGSARQLFDAVAAEQERLIDNPKQFMTLSRDVSNLEKRALSEEKDPARLFSERDALVLYLSHFVRMVDISLEASNLSRSLPTRYTHPAWKNEVADQNAAAMKRIVAEAIALARCYPSEFEKNLDVQRASRLLVAARTAHASDLPFELLDDPVLEATAAGAGALMDSRPTGRQHYVILDIGAGTTDVAGCICIKVSEDHTNVWEIQSARGAKNQAGNVLDNALRKFILESSSLAKNSLEFEQSDRALRKTIRTEKETLFNQKNVLVELVTNELVEVQLENFLSEPTVQRMFGTITELVHNAAFAIREKDARVYLVPTGGGAGLPIVADLISEPLEHEGKRIKLELVSAMPELLQEAYPQIEPYYPQLAVAIGGAHPALPEQKAGVDRFEGDPGRKTLTPVYKS